MSVILFCRIEYIFLQLSCLRKKLYLNRYQRKHRPVNLLVSWPMDQLPFLVAPPKLTNMWKENYDGSVNFSFCKAFICCYWFLFEFCNICEMYNVSKHCSSAFFHEDLFVVTYFLLSDNIFDSWYCLLMCL